MQAGEDAYARNKFNQAASDKVGKMAIFQFIFVKLTIQPIEGGEQQGGAGHEKRSLQGKRLGAGAVPPHLCHHHLPQRGSLYAPPYHRQRP